jgi:hypothetical protein
MQPNSVPVPELSPADISRLIGLTAARAMLRGRGGKSPSLETLRRWANPRRGWKAPFPDAPRVILRTVRLNGELLTLPQWVEEFERERLRWGVRSPWPPPAGRPEKRRARDQERDLAFLAANGIGIKKEETKA